jgi:glycosyltransferase involved in cell wall biosynthesis
LKIAIEVRVQPGYAGGTAPALRSLILALGALTDGPEEYAILVFSDEQIEWLGPLGPNQKIITFPKSGKRSLVRRALSPIAQTLRGRLVKPPVWPEVPVSSGFYESLGSQVIHFPSTYFTLCAVPSVYNPHDLQHLHYPQFFSADNIAWRETVYSAGCHFAKTVVVNSQWIKDDIARQYGISATKMQVIPEASPTEFENKATDLISLRERYRVPDRFLLYPSMSWPHKNHIRLFEALAYLRDRRGLVAPLVCTGVRHEPSWPDLQAHIRRLGLTEQVNFLGFLPGEDLRGLYRLAQALVLPTLFEANSLPIFEAWFEGTPVACSHITALPEQVGDAGLLFDPHDPASIGDSLARLWSDPALCDELREKGRSRLAHFDWARTARAYRAVYRNTAGQRLSDDDRAILEWDWMRNPRASDQLATANR